MADDDLFLDDDKPKRKQPGAGAAPAPGFDAFADINVEAGIGKLEASGEDGEAPSEKKKRGSARRRKSAAAQAPAVAVDSGPSDGDKKAIIPERAENLWPCPHCGAKNKPERDNCRVCGKTVDDDVELPIQYQPWFKPVVAAAVVVVLILIIMSACSAF